MFKANEENIISMRWWTLSAVSVSVLVIVLSTTMMNVALPSIQGDLGATASELQWMVVGYTMVFGTLLMIAGSLGDKFGYGKVLQIGLIIFGLANLGAYFSTSAAQLINLRVFMGLGAAFIMPSTLSIITNVFPANERGQAIGIWAGLNAIGIALGPIISGILVQKFTWHTIFLVNVPVALASLLMGWFYVPDLRINKQGALDIKGTLLSLIGLGFLM